MSAPRVKLDIDASREKLVLLGCGYAAEALAHIVVDSGYQPVRGTLRRVGIHLPSKTHVRRPAVRRYLDLEVWEGLHKRRDGGLGREPRLPESLLEVPSGAELLGEPGGRGAAVRELPQVVAARDRELHQWGRVLPRDRGPGRSLGGLSADRASPSGRGGRRGRGDRRGGGAPGLRASGASGGLGLTYMEASGLFSLRRRLGKIFRSAFSVW